MLEPPRRTCRRLGRLLKKGRHGAAIANFSNATLSPEHDTHAKRVPVAVEIALPERTAWSTKRNCAYNPRLLIVPVILPEQKIHVYEVRPRSDKRGFDLSRSEASYPYYHEWLSKTCHRAGFTPKVLQDVDLERTMIHAISAGLGVALVPKQLKKLPHKNVVFRPVKPAVATEACAAWKGENPSAPLKAYVEIVEHVGRSIR
jgi:LysR substrate binding domain-containing protein